MTLYTFYQDEFQRVVYGTVVDGSSAFFYKGFPNAEEAKNEAFDAYMTYKLAQRKPNAQGIMRPTSVLKAEIEMVLSGEWSEIQ